MSGLFFERYRDKANEIFTRFDTSDPIHLVDDSIIKGQSLRIQDNIENQDGLPDKKTKLLFRVLSTETWEICGGCEKFGREGRRGEGGRSLL